MPAVRSVVLGFAFALAAMLPAAGQSASGGDAQKLVGIWRLVSITTDNQVNPLRGGKPTGYIFYTASGEMGAMIQPERAPIAMAAKEPSPQEALAALKRLHRLFRHLHRRRESQDRHPSPHGQRAAGGRGRRAAQLPVRAGRPAGPRRRRHQERERMGARQVMG